MPDNVLKATISVTAPGAQAAFDKVAAGTRATEQAFNSIAPGIEKFKAELSNFPVGSINQLRAAAARLKIELQNLTPAQLNAGLGKGLSDSLKVVNAEMASLSRQAGITGTTTTNEFSKIYSAVRQLAFILPGIGIAGIFNLAFEAIQSVVSELFSVNTGFSEGEIAAARFAEAMDKISKAAETLKSKLDFQDDISKLKAQLAGLKGNELDIFDLGNRSASAKEIITSEQQVTQGLEVQKTQVQELAKAYIATGLASTKFGQLAAAAAKSGIVPKTLIADLPKKEQELANAYVTILKQIEDSKKRSADAQSLIGKNFLQSEIDQNAAQEELLKKRASDYDKFTNEIIAKGKKLVSEFGDVSKIHLSVLPTFTELDTKQEQLKKAQDVIKNVSDFFNNFSSKQRVLNLIIPFEPIPIVAPPDPVRVEQFLKETKEGLRSVLEGFKEGGVEANVPVDVNLIVTAVKFEKIAAFKKDLASKLASSFNIKVVPEGLDETEKKLLGIQNALITTAETLTGVLTPAFQDLFSAIISGGDLLKSFFKGLEQAVAQLISKIVAAAVEALILSAIFGSVGGAKGFGAIFGKLLGFAEGGRPPVGKQSIVGEKGQEIFKPDSGRPVMVGVNGAQLFMPKVSGTIIPNHKISNFTKNLFGGSRDRTISLGQTFNNFGGFRAAGGAVQAGKLFVVGENKAELFVPGSGASIRPAATGVGGVSVGSGALRVEGEFVLRGNTAVALIRNTERSQSRLS